MEYKDSITRGRTVCQEEVAAGMRDCVKGQKEWGLEEEKSIFFAEMWAEKKILGEIDHKNLG